MTFYRQKRFLYILLSCFCITAASTNVSAAPANTTTNSESAKTTDSQTLTAPKVTAEAAIIMDASTGVVLYDKNSTEAEYPASITKILTTLIAIENSSLSDTVTFSNNAVFGVDLDSSRIGIDVGEKLSMQDCLYGIMLSSANEVSYAVAEHVGGTMENFVAMMNERAKELGCVNTHFANPHGLQQEDHYTCPYDMALIAREAIKNTTFAKITGTRTYVIAPTNLQKESRPLANHHKFIKGDLRYDGVIGGKTGYTSSAKYTLVTYAKRDNMELICVVMGSDSTTTEYTDTSSLLDFVFNNYSIHRVSGNNTSLVSDNSAFFTKYSSIFSTNGSFLTTGDNGYVVLPNNASLNDVTVNVTYNTPEQLVDGDNIIGHVNYMYQEQVVGQANIIYRNKSTSELPTMINSFIDTSSPNPFALSGKRNSIFSFKVILIILVILFIAAYIILKERRRIKRRKAYHKRRQAYKKKYSDYNRYE